MRARLLPCPGCNRHVRIHERSCPFCADSIPERVAPPIVTTAQTSRLSRSARMALGAALAAALPACGGAAPDPAAPAPAPTSTTAGEPTNPPDDDGAPVAEYGAPAPPDDDGSQIAEYGAPPHPDEGGMAPKYGAPPPH